MQSPSEILSQINSFFTGKIRRKSSDSLTSPSPDDEEDSDSSSDSEVTIRSPKKTGKVRRYSETTNYYRKHRGYRATVSRHSQNAVNFMRMAKQDIKLNLKRLSFGDNTPPALPARHFSIGPDEELPPPIPERKCSLECFLDVEFERRFTFRSMSTCRLPEPFTDCKKTYPSAQPRRKALQRPVVEPPPPPPPQDSSLSSPDSPHAVFSLSSPPFKSGIGGGGRGGPGGVMGVRKISSHQIQNGGANKNNNRNFKIREDKNDDLPLPPPPPDPFTKLGTGNRNGTKDNQIDLISQNGLAEPAVYSKAQKTKSRLETLFHNRQNSIEEEPPTTGNPVNDVFGKLNGSQTSMDGAGLTGPPLPPSLIPPPPSKPLPPPPPLSAKPNVLIRTNSNQQLAPSTNASPRGMRNSISTPVIVSSSTSSSPSYAENRKSLMLDITNGHNNDVIKSSPKTQRSISTPTLPPPLPSRNSMISFSSSPSLPPKPASLLENESESSRSQTKTVKRTIKHEMNANRHSAAFSPNQQSKSNGIKPHTNGIKSSYYPESQTNSKNDNLLHVDVHITNSYSPKSSPSSSSNKLTSRPQSSPVGNARPLPPPKKDGLMTASSNSQFSSSSRPLSGVFAQPAFSSQPLPQPPPLPNPTSSSYASSPPQTNLSCQPSSSGLSTTPSLSSSSSSSSPSQRKLSDIKKRPLPPPPRDEEGFLCDGMNRRSWLGPGEDYGEGWGGKETFDPREEDGDLYDLMDSTNM